MLLYHLEELYWRTISKNYFFIIIKRITEPHLAGKWFFRLLRMFWFRGSFQLYIFPLSHETQNITYQCHVCCSDRVSLFLGLKPKISLMDLFIWYINRPTESVHNIPSRSIELCMFPLRPTKRLFRIGTLISTSDIIKKHTSLWVKYL